MFLLSISSAFSQFDAQFSQYMFHISAFNPAAVGQSDMIQVAGQHRLQWLGMPNAGQTTVFSINSPVKIGGSSHGAGVRFLNDNVGQFTNRGAYLQYAYKKTLGAGVLSLGADLGVISLGFRGDSVRQIPIGDYHRDISADPEIPKTSVAGNNFDMNVGVFYSTSLYYAGLSFSHLNNPTIMWGDHSQFSPAGTLYLTGGYNWSLPDTKYVLRPSTLVKSDLRSIQVDVSTLVEYDNKYWGGLTYRYGDAAVFLAGINLVGGLSIGYSYDLPVSQMLRSSWGSHEVALMYNFEYVFGQRSSKYKSIKIL